MQLFLVLFGVARGGDGFNIHLKMSLVGLKCMFISTNVGKPPLQSAHLNQFSMLPFSCWIATCALHGANICNSVVIVVLLYWIGFDERNLQF